MTPYALLMTAVVLVGPPSSATAGQILVPRAVVSLIDEAHVSSKEPGVLMEVSAKEGTQVRADDLLVRLDDQDAQAANNVAIYEAQKAELAANDKTSIDYATSDMKVSWAEWQAGIEANKGHSGTVPAAELRRLELVYQRGVLSIQKAQMENEAMKLEAKVKTAEAQVAAEKLRRRQVVSPIDGVVREVYRHKGEWVQAGDPVAHVVRLDRLRADGALNINEVSPADVDGRDATVTVDLARGRRESFPGKVVFVDPRIVAGGEFRVKVEVANRMENGQWLLLPGLDSQIAIHTK